MKFYKSPEGRGNIRWAVQRAAEDRTDIFGNTIPAGSKYVRFLYRRGEDDYVQLGIKTMKDSGRCDQCGVPVWKMGKVWHPRLEEHMVWSKRFCCPEHGDVHLENANRDFEDHKVGWLWQEEYGLGEQVR